MAVLKSELSPEPCGAAMSRPPSHLVYDRLLKKIYFTLVEAKNILKKTLKLL